MVLGFRVCCLARLESSSQEKGSGFEWFGALCASAALHCCLHFMIPETFEHACQGYSHRQGRATTHLHVLCSLSTAALG